MRSDYAPRDSFEHILAALMPANRLALETSLATGLRIDDVLSLRTDWLLRDRFTIKEHKTGKRRRVRLPQSLRDALFKQAGRFFVFEHRYDQKRHRTRQAVWKDLHRTADAFRIKHIVLSPHSARKIYAVSVFQNAGSLKKVQQLLQHDDEAVTMLYAMADVLTERHTRGKETRLPK
jgi:site-specific recombinase XerD